MYKLEKLVEINDGAIVDSDLSVLGAICYLETREGICSLIVAKEAWSSWSKAEFPNVRHVRWISEDQVALWPKSPEGGSVNAVHAHTKIDDVVLPIGQPRDIIVSNGALFASYGEEAYLLSDDQDVASNLIAVFDKGGGFRYGLRDFLKNGMLDGAIEAQCACVTEDDSAIFALYPSENLWIISSVNATVERIEFPRTVRGISAMCAIRDNVFFAEAGPSQLFIGSFDRRLGVLREEGVISYSDLEAPVIEKRLPIRVRGCAEGTFLVVASNIVWSLRFS
jgi:hypothetical protein